MVFRLNCGQKGLVIFMKKFVSLITMLAVITSAFYVTKKERAYAITASDSDKQLLARAVNGEARGEPYEGQVAVAAVILNRVRHSSFPNTIPGVIYEPYAFTAVSDGQIDVPIAENSTVYKACEDALNGWDPSDGAIYYFNPETATSAWIWTRTPIKTIGKHRFCK